MTKQYIQDILMHTVVMDDGFEGLFFTQTLPM